MYTTFEGELERSGKLAYTNVGVSMLPLIRQGKDVMVIEKADTYRPLDAVLFRRKGVTGRGAYVLHRILKSMPDGKYWIVGDNCVSGELVERGNILGLQHRLQVSRLRAPVVRAVSCTVFYIESAATGAPGEAAIHKETSLM